MAKGLRIDCVSCHSCLIRLLISEWWQKYLYIFVLLQNECRNMYVYFSYCKRRQECLEPVPMTDCDWNCCDQFVLLNDGRIFHKQLLLQVGSKNCKHLSLQNGRIAVNIFRLKMLAGFYAINYCCKLLSEHQLMSDINTRW